MACHFEIELYFSAVLARTKITYSSMPYDVQFWLICVTDAFRYDSFF